MVSPTEFATRADALEKVTGAARYTADVELPGMLYAAILRSPVANGRVVSLDVAPARAISGVRGTVEHDDMPDTKLDGIRLFDREVHYAGQPLAAVCADSLEIARQAVERIHFAEGKLNFSRRDLDRAKAVEQDCAHADGRDAAELAFGRQREPEVGQEQSQAEHHHGNL